MTTTDRIDRAREAVRRAADVTDDATVHEQLQSIDEGLREMTHAERTEGDDSRDAVKTEGAVPHDDDLREVEEKLVGLADETDGDSRAMIEDARDLVDEHRREVTRDW